MDSKSGPPPSSSTDDEPAPPPAYTESVAGSSTNDTIRPNEKSQSFSQPTSNKTAQHYSAQIQQQLSKLNSTIATIETQKSILTSSQDDKLLALLTPEIQLFLSDFATSDFTRGTLVLVPRAGLKDESAIPPEFLDRKDQFDRVVRLGDRDEDYHRTREEYGYGYEEEVETGDLLFWRDEVVAKRLAAYLRPAREPRPRVPKELPPRKEEVKAMQPPAKASSGFGRSFWGRKKEAPPTPPVVEEPRMDVKPKPQAPEPVEDKVIMDVKGEEVYFRTENDFGLLGSKTGYCIVLKLRVILG